MRRPSGLKEMLPLSPLQEGMLFHALLHDDGPDVYTVQWEISLEGPLDSVAMRAAGQALLDRHTNLRAGYRHVKSGNAVAVIPHRVELPWHELSLSELDATERAAELARYLAEDRERRFDLANPPLMRFTLARSDPEHHHLVITYHHILLDGWSISLLREELFTLYARGGDGSGLAPVSPFRDYLAWLAAQDRPAAAAAWRQALARLAEPTLVADADQGRLPLAPDHVTTQMSEELTTALIQRARQLGVTLNTVIQAAWAVLLSRLTGRDDVVFGATVSGRPAELAGVETIIGLFINTVPTRVQLSQKEPIAQVLTRLQAEQTQLLAHHHFGLADIQRLAGGGPLFDTLVVYENMPTGSSCLAHSASELRITGEELYTVTHYPLAVVAHPGSALTLELFYRPDLFDRNTAEAMAGRLVRVLESVAADPDQPIGRIDILATEERHQLLVEWNDTAGAAQERTLPELFEAQAARTPHATAMVFENTEVTYSQLNTEANRLARVLIDHGVGPEQIVALTLPRSTEMVVALLAVLKTGGAYLPLDPSYPVERIAFMIDDADPVIILTTAALAPALPDGSASRQLVLDAPGLRATRAGCAGSDLTHAERAGALQIGNAAYVLYTSGSTGRPKGVVVSHDGVSSLVATAVDRLGVGPESRVLQFSSISFDVAVWELCMSLLLGGRLVIIPDERRVAGPALADFVREHAVTHLVLPPSLVALLPTDCALPVGTTLLVGTERVPPQLVTRWSTTLRLFAAYGLTETTVNSTLWRASPEWAGQSVPIGRPDPGTQVYVLDHALSPAPVGVTGELYVVGDGLARGYLGRLGLTAERFVADPYGPPGGRMYRTGDMARYQPDGCLEFLGRDDRQVKVRGFRVELGEIESVLSQHPQVTHAAVIADDTHASGVRRLVGYVVPAAADGVINVLAPWLREHLKQRLPGYMVPAALVMVDRLPLTVNGKLDVKALPKPDSTPATSGRAPRSPQERVLCRLFAEALELDRVDMDDNFFDLGGHSLTAARVIFQLRRTFDVDVPLVELFKRPTVASLTEAVIALRRGEELPREPSPDDAYEWDSTLPSYDNLPPRPRRLEAHVLLTGSTGFFGAFLLNELLTQTRCRVTCLVRAKDAFRAWERLHTNLKKYRLWESSFRQRISVIVGDLTQPRLGLNVTEYERLADEIDTIYHNAAQVRGLFSYEQFRDVNEGGTLELLRLATTSWLKTFHYVSTTDVATLEQAGQATPESGYAESKWRAERFVTTAMSYGVPAAVYRAPRLAGDSQTGLSNDHDIMFRVLRWILELGTAPKIDFSETWIPVDEAARLLVSVAKQHHDGSRFVLTTQRQIHFTQVLDTARRCGYQIDIKPVHEWEHDFMIRSPEEYQIMSSIFNEGWGDRTLGAEEGASFVDSEPTSEDFTSIVARGVDEGMLRLYLNSLRPATAS